MPRRRFLNVRPEARNYRGIGSVLVVAAVCSFVLGLPKEGEVDDGPQLASAAPVGPAAPALLVQTTGAASLETSQPISAAKLSILCKQKPTARRDCAEAQAAREAYLARATQQTAKAPALPAVLAADSAPSAPAAAAKPAVAAKMASINAPAAREALAEAAPEAEEEEADPPASAQQKPKPKRVRPVSDDEPIERLVRVGEHVLPDGRRVPVYRRSSGGYELGAIVGGEYRSTRRAQVLPPGGPRYFGLQ